MELGLVLRAIADIKARNLSSSPLGSAREPRVTAQGMGALIWQCVSSCRRLYRLCPFFLSLSLSLSISLHAILNRQAACILSNKVIKAPEFLLSLLILFPPLTLFSLLLFPPLRLSPSLFLSPPPHR